MQVALTWRFLSGNRLIMIMDTDESFTFKWKASMDADNPNVGEWNGKT